MKRVRNYFIPIFIITTFSTLIYSQEKTSPEIKIDVHKEFDDNGNIIRYDSTYAYSYYSNKSYEIDSVIQSFSDQSGFSFQDFFNYFDYRYNNFPLNCVDTTDSLHSYDYNQFPFITDPFFNFFDSWNNNLDHFHQKMLEHNKILEEFFKNFYEPATPRFPFQDSIPESNPLPKKMSVKNNNDIIEI